MKDKIVIITGATSGIGKSTAVKMASFGSHLVLIVRDLDKGQTVKAEILKGYPEAKIDLVEGDLASLFSVKKAIEQIKSLFPVIDILINNAGGVFEKKILTADGLEMGFQVCMVLSNGKITIDIQADDLCLICMKFLQQFSQCKIGKR